MSSNSGVRRRLAGIAATVVAAAIMVFAVPALSYGDEPPPPPRPTPSPDGTVSTTGTECFEKPGQPPVRPFVRVYLSEVAKDPVTVVFDTEDGTAVAPGDYAAIKGLKVTIPAGKISVDVPLDIVADGVAEPDEWFLVKISKPSIGQIGKGTGTVIVKDGGPPAGR